MLKKEENNRSWCRLPLTLLHDSDISAIDAVVFAVLLDMATDRQCIATAIDIATASGLPERTIKRSIAQLIQCGYIERTRTGRGSVYTLADLIDPPRRHGVQRSPQQPQPAPAEAKPARRAYGKYQHVELDDAQHTELVHDYGDKKISDYIRRVDTYCQTTGKHYADYAAVIREWIEQDKNRPVKTKTGRVQTQEDADEIDEYLKLSNRFSIDDRA